ncbi:sulfate ABC transporter permease subunit CysT [Thalassospira marina]|uniref:Sulfate transport system permease protein CysT n=1 Tax=Thalassospira marina TaxID=2048283 RepID=A0A2N3KT54_9PROT|nr:sulfate ABC transporter permease subunit CysT [Thalassospira marina]PKR53725.1 sulfate ABC transporter permease subunit CysT [Thalassospira marina]
MTVTIRKRGRKRVIPGFGITLGFTLSYLGVIVLVPLAAIVARSVGMEWGDFLSIIRSTRTLHALWLSFGAAFVAAVIDAIFGFLIAWVLVRYRFPGRKIVDALIDLPFALPTAVAGIALVIIYSPNGPIGQVLAMAGLRVAYRPVGVVIAMMFIGLPFVVRSVQPVLEQFDHRLEEAAASLGAGRLFTFRKVIFPVLFPALMTGFALALARGIGEYGSIIFIAGNIPNVSEIAPLLIIIRLEEFNYDGATVIATTMLVMSFAMLLIVNLLQAWSRKRSGN